MNPLHPPQDTNQTSSMNLAVCPRCGYDLRGTVVTWDEACPLSGTCTECGLEFKWAELLSTHFRKPPWCLEFTQPWWRFPVGMITTLAMTFRPWRFWQDVRMTHPLRPGRLLTYWLVMAVGLYLVFAASMGMAATRCWPFNTGGSYINTVPANEVALYTALWPFSNRMQGMANPSAVMRAQSPGILPLSGSIPINTFVDTYATNKELLLALFTLTGFVFFCPLGFIALPQSRRQAKVRWRHIIRIFLYSGGFWALLTGLIFWSAQSRLKIMVGENPWLHERILGLTLYLTPLFLLLWWSFASSRYLKMRHPWAIGAAVTIMAGLGGAVVFFSFFVV